MSDSIPTNCPHCSHSINAPARFAGKKVKCPACKQDFTLPESSMASPAQSPKQESFPSSVIPPLPPNKEEQPESNWDQVNPKSPSTSKKKRRPRSRINKYPDLVWYLKWLNVLSKIYMFIAIVVPVGMIVVAAFVWIASGAIADARALLPFLFAAVYAVLIGVMLIASAFMLRVSIQMIQVFLDTEENTRRTAELLEN